MLKELRLEFVALNMAIAAGVLAVAFTTICFVNYQQSLQDVQNELGFVLDRAITAAEKPTPPSNALQDNPDAAEEGGLPTDAEGEPPTDATTDSSTSPDGIPLQIGGERGGGEPAIPVALYALAEDGSPVALTGSATASLSDEVLAEATSILSSADEGNGTLQSLGLHYQKRISNGTVYLAFADMAATSTWRDLIPLLAGVGAASLVAFLIVSILFSRWALKPVARAWDQQRRFVADASHDLKTPLTVILANTSILMQHPDRTIEAERQWLESTLHEAEDMQHLVEDLLLMAQVDEKAHPPFQRIDLAETVEAEALQFESIAFDRGLALECEIADDAWVAGDAALLRRMTSTLLENACKYASEGGTVKVTLAKAGREARLSVHNDGPAIPEEDLPHVFERFYRADKARAGGTGGYGLGLAIAHAIAEDHHGSLAATSDKIHGTTFTAAFPLASDGLAGHSDPTDRSSASRHRPAKS